jgi:hypothetical protein
LNRAAEPKPPVTLADALAAMVEKWKLDEMFKGISAFDEKMRRAYSSPGWLEFAKSVSTFESRFAETAQSPALVNLKKMMAAAQGPVAAVVGIGLA